MRKYKYDETEKSEEQTCIQGCDQERNGVGAQLDPMVVKGDGQFSCFNLESLQHHFEKSELRLCQRNGLYERIRFILSATNWKSKH